MQASWLTSRMMSGAGGRPVGRSATVVMPRSMRRSASGYASSKERCSRNSAGGMSGGARPEDDDPNDDGAAEEDRGGIESELPPFKFGRRPRGMLTRAASMTA